MPCKSFRNLFIADNMIIYYILHQNIIIQDDNYGRSVQTVNNENRIKYLKKELDDLKKQVDVCYYIP